MKLFLFVLFFSLVQTTCSGLHENTEVKMGRDIPANLIVVFKPNTSLDQRARFNGETIGRRIPGRDGVSLLKGIEASLALPDLCLHQGGLALKLRDDITEVQLQEIKATITTSPLVDRVLENIQPAQVGCVSK